MSRSLEDKKIVALISKRRTMCLIHRYLYWVKAEPLVGDQQYDAWERELRELVTARPDLECDAAYSLMCPTRTVGSSNVEDYPRTIEQLAESLLAYAKQKGLLKR